MTDHPLRSTIDALWESRDSLSAATTGTARDAVEAMDFVADNVHISAGVGIVLLQFVLQ